MVTPCLVGRCLRGIRKNELYGFHFEYANDETEYESKNNSNEVS